MAVNHLDVGSNPAWREFFIFGSNRARTDNFVLAKHTLYQLSYTPFIQKLKKLFNEINITIGN